MPVILALGFIFILITTTEIIWRSGHLAPEMSRKIIHILGGISIAFWPFFMSYQTIQLLALGLFIGITISYWFHIFGSIHKVKRSTKGELFYPIGIGACALLAPPAWIFAAAILHMAVADGLAALIGVKWGKKTRYKFCGQKKSLVGTGAFFITSLVIITTSYGILGGEILFGASILALVGVAALAASVEHLAWYGVDNLIVPLTIIFALSAI